MAWGLQRWRRCSGAACLSCTQCGWGVQRRGTASVGIQLSFASVHRSRHWQQGMQSCCAWHRPSQTAASWRRRWRTLAPAQPERPRTRAAAAAARAAEQELERRCEPALQRLAARLQAGAGGQPLLPEQEAAALLQQVRQQLVLRERLAQQLEDIELQSLKFVFRGCSFEMSEW